MYLVSVDPMDRSLSGQRRYLKIYIYYLNLPIYSKKPHKFKYIPKLPELTDEIESSHLLCYTRRWISKIMTYPSLILSAHKDKS